MLQGKYEFMRAVPVWKKGDTKVKNQALALEYTVSPSACKLNISAHTAYTVLVNEILIAYGPARCAHGYHKVDEIELSMYLTEKENTVTIRVFGYNVTSYEFADSPSFVCAEIVRDGTPIAYTDTVPCGFYTYLFDEKMIKTPRFSGQRTFVECYDLRKADKKSPLTFERCGEKRFLSRGVPYSKCKRIYPVSVIAKGEINYDESAESYTAPSITGVGTNLYHETELDAVPHIEASRFKVKNKQSVCEPAEQIFIDRDGFVDLEFPINQTGIPAFSIEADGDGEIFMLFDECLSDGEVDPFRLKTVAVVSAKFSAGRYNLVCAEPYTMKYIRFVARGAKVRLLSPHLFEIAFPESEIKMEFSSPDKDMEKVYRAAVESFRANTTDIYMDCPSRERAGWLFDSFFTARVEYILTGKCEVEREFLTNFLYHGCEKLPDGMLPMCYPADHVKGRFIPNWAMWYLLELYEYTKRSGSRDLADAAKERMYKLLGYFRGFENEYGLLESLESWVFVEWSRANDLVQDVSFASNMIYALFLERLGKLYRDEALIENADKLRVVIRELSMTPSGFFSDNAKRIDGKLVTTGERTEVCQYYAFYTGVATKEMYPELWKILIEDFGPNRKAGGLYPEIYQANVLPGNYLRLELLSDAGIYDKLYSEIKEYFVYMANITGTLWEHDSNRASMNHGFTSHAVVWMEKLGLLRKKT